MALQHRLANIPQMFSEGIEEGPEGKGRRRGDERRFAARIAGVSAMLAVTLGGRVQAKDARASIHPA